MRIWAERELQSRGHDAQLVLDRLPRKWRRESLKKLCAWVQPEYLRAIEQWDWDCGRNVVLLGRSKVGKSTAAAILFRVVLSRAVHSGGEPWRLAQSMRWYRAEELLDAQRGHPLGRGEAKEVRLAKSCSLLFLDELGWKDDQGVVQTVMSARYEQELPTVITSGFGKEDILIRYGDAVARRLASCSARTALLGGQ